ncbi:MAG: matrixin family metalloprotease [Novosphingobium sp.]
MAEPTDRDRAVWASLATRGYLATGHPSHGEADHAEGVVPAPAAEAPSEGTLREAVLALQRRYRLPETGEVDVALEAFLLAPHCGVPDPASAIDPELAGLDLIEATGAGRWLKLELTYQFMSWPPGLAVAGVRQAFRNACTTWEQACALRFREVAAGGDMRIHFGARNHGDPWPFDGRERTLAHAFYPNWKYPLNGDIHVDTDEIWSVSDNAPGGSKDLESVFLHEIGHAIGLEHVNNTRSVMFANYAGIVRTLFAADSSRIRAIYG